MSAVRHAASPDGTRIGYRTSGSGRPLLLVHGTTADRGRWAPVTPLLEPHFTVCAMDRRGRGDSGDGPVYGVAREAEDIAAVVEALGPPVYVLGHSFGAVCSLEAALVTDGIGRLALYEPPIPTGIPQYPPGLPERLEELLAGEEREAALEAFFREVVRMPESELAVYRRLPAWRVRVDLAHTIPREMTLDRTYRFDPARFADLRTPTLLLVGGDSPPLFTRPIALLGDTLPLARTAVLDGQQHVAMDTDTELFVRNVLHFFLE